MQHSLSHLQQTMPLTPAQDPALNATAIDNAIAGRYALPKLKLLGKAWQRQTGSGAAVRRALAFLLIPLLPLLFLISYLLQQLPLSLPPPVIHLLQIIISLPLLAPWITGLMLIGIDAARGTPTHFARVIECYRHIVPLTTTALAAFFVSMIGTLLFVLPGLYLLVGCTLALPLVIDAKLPPLRAISVSLKAIHHRWFDFAAIIVLLLLVTFSGMMLAGLPLWFTLPWQLAVLGVAYCAIFRDTATHTLHRQSISPFDNRIL